MPEIEDYHYKGSFRDNPKRKINTLITKLGLRQVSGLIMVLVLAIMLPVTITVLQQQQELRQRASTMPLTSPVTITSTPSVKQTWRTSSVSLETDAFILDINGVSYYANTSISIHSDPANFTMPDFTTLEATWKENGVEMRAYFYFQLDTNNMWRLYEVRSYNGQNPGDWLYFVPTDANGNPIQHFLSETYRNSEITLMTKPGTFPVGKMYFKNLQLRAFIERAPTSTPQLTPTTMPKYTISGQIFVDANSNGVKDVTESTYPYGANLSLADGQKIVSNAEGSYSFSPVTGGAYLVTLTVPSAYKATTLNPVSLAVAQNLIYNFGIAPLPTSTPTVMPTWIVTPTPTISYPTPIPQPTSILIYAKGTQVDKVFPTMQLLIDNVVVATWSNVSGKATLFGRTPTLYSYSHPVPVTQQQIKVKFINDAKTRTQDRNLFVDKIVVAGTTYQTEARNVYSSSCKSGFFRTEWLKCNGYFQY